MTSTSTKPGLPSVRVVAIGYEGHPSTRLRLEQYAPSFQKDGIRLTTLLLPQSNHHRFRAYGPAIWRAVEDADVVLVQRVLLTWLNGLLWLSRKPVVFDLDDSVQYIRPTQLERTIRPRGFKDKGRVLYRRLVRRGRYYSSRKRLLKRMLSFCRVAIVANSFLRDDIATSTPSSTIIVPTSVPARRDCLKEHRADSPITIGWVGTGDNLLHLRTLEPAFRALADRFGDSLRLHVVTSQPYRSEFLSTDFTRWSLERESSLVRRFDVGLMPLVDDAFSRGKSAFKAILCMSFGVPVVISPVGVNVELVKDGWNGFLASTSTEWVAAITRLVQDHELRARLGFNAFRTIEKGFSTALAYPVLKSTLIRTARGESIDGSQRSRTTTALR